MKWRENGLEGILVFLINAWWRIFWIYLMKRNKDEEEQKGLT
jgi:hypothetical protein